MAQTQNEQQNQINAPTPKQQKTKAVDGSTYHHRNKPVFVPDGYLVIGRITSPHSLTGEVRVELHTDFPERFVVGMTVFMGTDLKAMVIQMVRPHKQIMLLKLANITSRIMAEALRGQWLFIREEDAFELEDDTYWVHEIIGMTVETDEKEVLGVISDVLFTGANDVYIIQGTDAEGNKREVLLPAIADVVQEVDPAQQRMIVHLIPGLIS